MPSSTGNRLDCSGPEGSSGTLYAQNHERVGCQQLFWWIYQDDTCWFTCHCASEFWQDIQGKNKLLASFWSQILKTIFFFKKFPLFFTTCMLMWMCDSYSCGSPQGVAASNNCVLGSYLCNFGTIIAVMNCIQHLQIFGCF